MYKPIYFIWLLLIPLTHLQAQDPNTCRVVFTVDMQKEDIAKEGVYITGNFFNMSDLEMESKENGLYQYVIRVSKKDTLFYNFKNGIPETEQLPADADCLSPENTQNRMLVVPDVDSLEVPIVCYGSCQDCDFIASFTSRVKITVDMAGEEVPSEGIFIKGNFFNGNPELMSNEGNDIFSYTLRASVGDTITYQFGKGLFDAETISSDNSCVQPGNTSNRMLVIPNSDVYIPPTVCYGSCSACNLTNTSDLITEHQMGLMPNVTNNSQTQFVWSSTSHENFQIQLFTNQGKLLKEYYNIQQSPFLLTDLNYPSGLYILNVQNEKGETGILKLVIQ